LAGNHKSDAGNFYSSDLNSDGIPELLIASTGGGRIYWGQGTPSNPSWSASQRTDLPDSALHSIMAADLNGDGRPELVLTNNVSWEGNSFIYWGQAGGTFGVRYDTDARTVLPMHYTLSASVADLNRDGRPELIFVTYANTCCWTANSYIYWGQAGGAYYVNYNDAHRTALPTSGGRGIAIADLNSDGLFEIIIANSIVNNNSFIYWGQAGGAYGVIYDATARTELPTNNSAAGVTVAELNNDDLPELIFITESANQNFVYWGQAGGVYGVTYDSTARTTLPAPGASRVSVANPNGDSHLDVVIQGTSGGPTGGSLTRIFWGPLPIGGQAVISWTLGQESTNFHALSLSDINNDERPDLLIGHYATASSVGGRVYFHSGDSNMPYNAPPGLDLPVNLLTSLYASFGTNRGTNSDRFNEPRSAYGTAVHTAGVLESMIIDGGQPNITWHEVTATTYITSGTGITLFVAASDHLGALTNPSWTQVGAMGNGNWSQLLSGVNGRYARYKVVLWRDRTTEASPTLEQITFNYLRTPSAFSKSTPLNGAAKQPISLTLSWAATDGADHYRYCNSSAISTCIPGINAGTATSVTLNGLLPGATYYWQVRACADAGCTLFTNANSGAHWSYTVAITPSGFNKTAPANGATNQLTSITLMWSASTGTDHYRYCYATAPGCIPTISTGTTTSAVLSGLTTGTTYYWQVRACADTTCTIFRDANDGEWSFTVMPPPGTFSKTAPANGSMDQPANLTLSWGAASGVHHYRYCHSTTPGCVPATHAGMATSVMLSGLTAGVTHYWQIRACADAQCTVFSDADSGHWAFTVPAAPETFNKTSPGNGATGQPMNLTLSWTSASGANHYRYCYSTVPGCTPTTNIGAATNVLLSGLTAGATYYWQARACADAGCTVFSDANDGTGWLFTVTTAPGAFNKLSPANGASDQSVNPTLSWTPASGVHHYRLCHATSPGCTPATNVGTATGIALGGLTAGATYYWQVRACGDAWCTAFTNAQEGHWSFTTMALPTGFNKIEPVNGAIKQPTSLLLRWNAMSGAHHYRYCYSTTPGCTPTTSTGMVNSAILSGLAEGATYYWQVRACSHAACIAFTNANDGYWTFTVARQIDSLDNLGTRILAAPATVKMGDLVTYTIVLSNAGGVGITARVTDTLAVSATLVSATPGYTQSEQALTWSGVNIAAGEATVLTVTVQATSGPLPNGYLLNNGAIVGASGDEITRSTSPVMIEPYWTLIPAAEQP
jgi:uncharacterized repeat protein (TIGR01451 family)